MTSTAPTHSQPAADQPARPDSPENPPSFVSCASSVATGQSTSSSSAAVPRRRTRKPPAPPPPAHQPPSADSSRSVDRLDRNQSAFEPGQSIGSCSSITNCSSFSSLTATACASPSSSQPVSASGSLQRRRKSTKSRPAPPPPPATTAGLSIQPKLPSPLVETPAEGDLLLAHEESLARLLRLDFLDQLVVGRAASPAGPQPTVITRLQPPSCSPSRSPSPFRLDRLPPSMARLGRSLSEAYKLNAKRALFGVQPSYNSELALAGPCSCWFDQPLLDLSGPWPTQGCSLEELRPADVAYAADADQPDWPAEPVRRCLSLPDCVNLQPEPVAGSVDDPLPPADDPLRTPTSPIRLAKRRFDQLDDQPFLTDEWNLVSQPTFTQPPAAVWRTRQPCSAKLTSSEGASSELQSDTSDGKITVKSLPQMDADRPTQQDQLGWTEPLRQLPAHDRPPPPQPRLDRSEHDSTLQQLHYVKQRLLQDCWLLQRLETGQLDSSRASSRCAVRRQPPLQRTALARLRLPAPRAGRQRVGRSPGRLSRISFSLSSEASSSSGGRSCRSTVDRHRPADWRPIDCRRRTWRRECVRCSRGGGRSASQPRRLANGEHIDRHEDEETMQVQHTNRLLQQLQLAISVGEFGQAVLVARELALHKVGFTISSAAPLPTPPPEQSITVNFHIDLFKGSMEPIRLQVNPAMTLAELKEKVEKEYLFPARRQLWQLGNGLAADDQASLRSYGLAESGRSIHLYLSSSDEFASGLAPAEPLDSLDTLAAELNGVILAERQLVDRPKQRPGTKQPTPEEDYKSASEDLASDPEDDWDQPQASTSSGRRAKCALQKAPAYVIKEYDRLIAMDDLELIPNPTPIDCPICMSEVPANEGVILHQCLHSYCRDCLANMVRASEQSVVRCPYLEGDVPCEGELEHREMRALLSEQDWGRFLRHNLREAINANAKETFQCKTPDCEGACFLGGEVQHFRCPLCAVTWCVWCGEPHQTSNCPVVKRKQDESETEQYIQTQLENKAAMRCPNCTALVVKVDGCDQIFCTMCKTQLCWATKMTRWGPRGKGDISAGCRCMVRGVRCHQNCQNCH